MRGRPRDGASGHPVPRLRELPARAGPSVLATWATWALTATARSPSSSALRADRVRRLPPGVDFRFASLLEPVAVCLEAVERGRVADGETVLVIGDGPFGILIARLALQRSPGGVILAGPSRIPPPSGPRGRRDQRASERADVRRDHSGSQRGTGRGCGHPGHGLSTGAGTGRGQPARAGRVVVFSALHGAPSVDWFRLHTQELEILGACNDQDLIGPALAVWRIPRCAWTRSSRIICRSPNGRARSNWRGTARTRAL